MAASIPLSTRRTQVSTEKYLAFLRDLNPDSFGFKSALLQKSDAETLFAIKPIA
jgi:hypothetical protein